MELTPEPCVASTPITEIATDAVGQTWIATQTFSLLE